MNAEIASGTVASLSEAVGYITWTFFARRVRANPSYYGAMSSSDDDVEDFLLAFARDALSKLSSSGCIDYGDGNEDESISPLVLGRAASSYYLMYQTPKQMQLGVREARKLVVRSLEESESEDYSETGLSQNHSTLGPFTRPCRVDELSAAWLLYVLCSTHEFDEHPVRHNEEFINEELSSQLVWGPDTSGLLSGGSAQHSMEIFQDPHTKCFLLVQAFLERVRLPISDYVNDTKTIVENIPRLLAAMHYIARDDRDAAGSFELLTQFSRTLQLFYTRSLADHDPLMQLPGMTNDIARRVVVNKNSVMRNKATNEAHSTTDKLADLRALPRDAANSVLEKQYNTRSKRNSSPRVDAAMDALYALPLVRLVEYSVRRETEKSSGRSSGKVKLVLEVTRDKPSTGSTSSSSAAASSSFTVTLILGSFRQRMLLSYATARYARFGRWTVTRELDFDWDAANADGGEAGGGRAVLRVLFDEVRGLDAETVISLRAEQGDAKQLERRDDLPEELPLPVIPIGHPDTMMSVESVRRAAKEFRVRPTDIVVATFPKTGTTLVTWICHLLRTGGGGDLDGFDTMYEVVPWPLLSWDIGYDPNVQGSQYFPRVFKSHLRLASVYRGCRYIVTVRRPECAALSFYNFFLAKQVPLAREMDFSTFVVETPFLKGREGRASIWEFYREYHAARDCSSVLVLVYEDLIEDMPKHIRMIASFLGIEADDELVGTVAEMSTKEYMARHMEKFDEPYERAKELGRAGDLSQLAPGAKVAVRRHRQTLTAEARRFLEDRWNECMSPLGYDCYDAFASAFRERNARRFPDASNK